MALRLELPRPPAARPLHVSMAGSAQHAWRTLVRFCESLFQ